MSNRIARPRASSKSSGYFIAMVAAVILTHQERIEAEGRVSNVRCVADPVAPWILSNRSMSYIDKVALLNANRDARAAYRVGRTNTPPALCPQLSPGNTFDPHTFWRFSFQYSAVADIMNATAAGVSCGLDCSSASSGVQWQRTGDALSIPDTATVSYDNASTNVTATTVGCTIQGANDTSLPQDFVCTAYIRYNATYWENATVYAAPDGQFSGEGPAMLDPTTATFAVGMTSTLSVWLPASLTTCPWYIDAGGSAHFTTPDEFLAPGVAPSVVITMTYTSPFGNNTVLDDGRTFPLVGAQCQVASPHPLSGAAGVRFTGSIPVSLSRVFEGLIANRSTTDYNLSVTSFTPAYFMPIYPVAPWNYTTTSAANGSSMGDELPAARLQYLGAMVPGLSPWRPFANYSLPALANVPRRCYAAAPRDAAMGDTTLYLPTLTCGCGNLPMTTEVVNDTAFCCAVANLTSTAAATFVWPQFVEVYDVGMFWFTDTAGIVATPAPSRPTQSPQEGDGTSNAGTENSGSRSSSGDSSLSSSGGQRQSQDNGEDTALVLGICLLGIAGVAVIMALVYFKWWKPRQADGGCSAYHKNGGDGGGDKRSEMLSAPILADSAVAQLSGVFVEVDPYDVELL